MHRASCCNVQINRRHAALLMNDLYYPLIGSTCFGLSPVHHQEHHLLNCITHWYVRAGKSSCCVDVHGMFVLSGESSCCVDVHGMFVQANITVAWMYMVCSCYQGILAVAPRNSWTGLHEHTNALYSLRDDAPDDGLVIVRNMQSQIMNNKDHSKEMLPLLGLSTH